MRGICGPRSEQIGGSTLDTVLSHLGKELNQIFSELEAAAAWNDRAFSLYVPLLCRALLEVGFTAIVARLDPFRVLTIQRMQMTTDYDHSIPWRTAMRWQGDILTNKTKDMWAASVDTKDVSRALFGDYYDELIWQPAVKVLSDETPLSSSSRWLTELLSVSPESFCPRKREAVSALYSKLSKAIHFEAVSSSVKIEDRVTVAELAQRVIREVVEVALVSHFVPHAYSACDFQEAVAFFCEIEAREVIG